MRMVLPIYAALAVVLALPARAGERADLPAGFHVTGYLPDYRLRDLDPGVGRALTEIVYFSVEPQADGTLDRRKLGPDVLKRLHAIKDRHPVKLTLCVGGWGRSKAFPALAASSASREKFAVELTRFCAEDRFDGVDLDWEHPKNKAEAQDYGRLLSAIKKVFTPKKLTLTIAVAGWQDLVPEAVASVDRVNLMAYDGPGRHSTFEFARSDVARVVAKGVPAEKISLGVPFYGRSVEKGRGEATYAQIIRKSHPAPDVDEVEGVYFNGVKTIEAKTRYALEAKLAGVMIWEVGQDEPGPPSLLDAIIRAAREGSGQRPTPTAAPATTGGPRQ